MRNTLLVPSEFPPSMREVKRALLCFDKVFITDPNDRDLFPPNMFLMTATGMPPILGADTGPVRPIGKVDGYDSSFDRLMDELGPARQQGNIEVVSSYDLNVTKMTTHGAVETGGFPLNTSFTFHLYRKLASVQSFIQVILDDRAFAAMREAANPDSIALAGKGDISINRGPTVPCLELQGVREDLQERVNLLARGRIGSLIKWTGYCQVYNLVPTYDCLGYGRLISQLLSNTRDLLSESDPTRRDPFWVRRTQAMQLAFNVLLDPERLDDLTVKDVLRLRTKASGRLGEKGQNAFDALFDLTDNDESIDDFESFVGPRLVEIRKEAAQLKVERESIRWRLICDLGMAAVSGTSQVCNAISQGQAPFGSYGTLLVAGGVWALARLGTDVPNWWSLREREREARRGAGFALGDFFSAINN